MLKALLSLACLFALILLTDQLAICAPSGLNVIPTADVLDRGIVSLELESVGSGQPFRDEHDIFLLTQIGVGCGLEFGVDHCLSDSDAWINAKWRVRTESDRLPAVALGVQGISRDDLAQPYLVFLKSMGKTRLHLGAMRIDHNTRCLFGVDCPIHDRASFQGDYISGDENSLTFGVAIGLSNSLSLTVARSVGNAPETQDGQIVNLAWSVALGGRK